MLIGKISGTSVKSVGFIEGDSAKISKEGLQFGQFVEDANNSAGIFKNSDGKICLRAKQFSEMD